MVGSSTRLGRRHVAVVAGSVALLTGGLLLRGTLAEAAPTTSTHAMTCPLAGAISVVYGVERAPDPVEAGRSGSLIVTPTVTTPAGVAGIGVGSMVITMPVPAGLINVDVKAADNGNFTLASAPIAGGVATVTLTADVGVTVGTLSLPTLFVGFDVPASAAGTTITAAAPTSIVINTTVDLGSGLIVETCTPNAANPPLATVDVVAGTAPTTATTGSTTTSTTGIGSTTSTTSTSSTTASTTSSTAGQGTTTTSRATTTTSRATTTTSRATTTTGAVAGVTTTTSGAAGGGAAPATPVTADPTFAG